MDYTEQKVRRINRYEGVVVNVTMDVARLSDGKTTLREVVEHPGGVCILPVDETGTAWCVRQYRYPMGEHLLEAPAGKLERGEDPLACAVRELSEETGFTAETYTDLGRLYPSPGYCHETLYIYLATGLTRGAAHLDRGEFLDVVQFRLDELYGMALRGELPDGKTAMAVIRAKLLLDEKEG